MVSGSATSGPTPSCDSTRKVRNSPAIPCRARRQTFGNSWAGPVKCGAPSPARTPWSWLAAARCPEARATRVGASITVCYNSRPVAIIVDLRPPTPAHGHRIEIRAQPHTPLLAESTNGIPRRVTVAETPSVSQTFSSGSPVTPPTDSPAQAQTSALQMVRSASRTGPRDTGISLIGDAPWGTHFCQFYQTQAGPARHSRPLLQGGARGQRVLHVGHLRAPRRGGGRSRRSGEAVPESRPATWTAARSRSSPYSEWYLKEGRFDSQRVLDGWVGQAGGRPRQGLRRAAADRQHLLAGEGATGTTSPTTRRR